MVMVVTGGWGPWPRRDGGWGTAPVSPESASLAWTKACSWSSSFVLCSIIPRYWQRGKGLVRLEPGGGG